MIIIVVMLELGDEEEEVTVVAEIMAERYASSGEVNLAGMPFRTCPARVEWTSFEEEIKPN